MIIKNIELYVIQNSCSKGSEKTPVEKYCKSVLKSADIMLEHSEIIQYRDKEHSINQVSRKNTIYYLAILLYYVLIMLVIFLLQKISVK